MHAPPYVGNAFAFAISSLERRQITAKRKTNYNDRFANELVCLAVEGWGRDRWCSSNLHYDHYKMTFFVDCSFEPQLFERFVLFFFFYARFVLILNTFCFSCFGCWDASSIACNVQSFLDIES